MDHGDIWDMSTWVMAICGPLMALCGLAFVAIGVELTIAAIKRLV